MYINRDKQISTQAKIGIVLMNLGSPDAPTPSALRRYLAEFLWDPRLIELPRFKWWLILHGIILRFRPKRSAAAYAEVWTEHGSPLINIARAQTELVAQRCQQVYGDALVVRLAMRYGSPNFMQAMREFNQLGIEKLLVVPLYPQYSATTQGSAFDAVFDALKQFRVVPELRLLRQYHLHPLYIQALCNSIEEHFKQQGAKPDRLLFSFHGIPQSYDKNGDLYQAHCYQTAEAVAWQMGLAKNEYFVSFQSRFGKEPFLTPYTDETLKSWPDQAVKKVAVICPGFSADCLETLEEIEVENRDYFLQAGGEQFFYIPALNTRDDHVDALSEIIKEQLCHWL
ncbi:MAG: ferrochelatase [Gammaproteobacteria bacterium]|nr:ferrochelatase [Gammaproteobacteria bacterium]MDH5730418.1 ferrochelatase [Gammaproteobacteria bacterium]